MPQKSPYRIVLTYEEKEKLERIARKYTSLYYEVVRAKCILYAAEDIENKEIAERLGLPRQVVSKWRKRFFEERLAGLEDRARPGRPRAFPPSGRRGGQSLGV